MKSGFSLVELLVVITIIVVLISMLAPAMDRAIYQAELAVCAAQEGTMGRGIVTYAAAHKRRYPVNPRVERADDNAQPHDIVSGFMTVTGNAPSDDDLRPAISSAFNLDAMVDPLSPMIDLETPKGGANLQLVMGSYTMWWGWQYKGARKMAKLGDRFNWTGASNPGAIGPARTATFDLLAGDRQHLKLAAEVQASHPDKDGLLQPIVLQDATDNPWLPGAFQVTFSCWRNPSSDLHGPMDMNHLHDDGSVSRIVDQIPYDVRTFPVPERMGNVNPGQNFPFIPEQSAP